nr:unnamed protein product [Callosobruchus chinensis]
MNACMDFSILGKLDSAYLRQRIKQNEEVDENRHTLRRLIMCMKFGGAFALELRAHDETSTSDNPGIYVGLVNFTAEIDSLLAIHMKGSQMFKLFGTNY